MPDISTLPQDPSGTQAQPTDLIPALRNGEPVALTVAQLGLGIQAALTQPADTVLGRAPNAGSGEVQPITPSSGLSLQSGTLAATAQDHLALGLLSQVDLNMELIINSAGVPKRIPFSALLAYLGTGGGASSGIDPNFLLIAVI